MKHNLEKSAYFLEKYMKRRDEAVKKRIGFNGFGSLIVM